MQIFAPEYYQSFQCSAAACTHSCCVGWEIDVDEDTLARYDALEGALGAEIRRGISRSADAACFTLDAAERCPNLRADGLCRIICELGEGYLCDICREHPRFYHTAGGRLECGVGASCEAAYSATKGAVIALTKALAKELGPSGVRVNCVAPGVILTDMCGNVDPEILEEMGQEACVGRNGTPEDVAKAMEYLADATFVTGHVLNVDGGYAI